MRSLRWFLAGLFVAALGVVELRGQQILQYGFEARGPVWKTGSTDAVYKVLAHELTSETYHTGQRCEHIRLQVEKGTFIHYTFDLPKAPINEELGVVLWLKSNRPGIGLLCRVVLPRERDPAHLDQPLTTLIRCEPYKGTLWKLVDLRQPVKRLREQKQLLTNKLGREVDTTGAYIDQLVLNVCDGPGVIDVWIDDLEVGPVLDTKVAAPVPVARTTPGVPNATPVNRRAAEVQVLGNQLKVSGKKFLLRGIRHTGTPLKTLREAGFNTVWLDESTPPALIEEAAALGFWMVPSIQPPRESPGERGDTQVTAGDDFARKVARFLDQESVLAWDLGSNLGAEQFAQASRLALSFRAVDPQRPVLADVWDGYRGYSRGFEQLMVGTHRWPLFTSMELSAYRDWLEMRRRLTADNYSWTWVQTHLPDWYTRLVYNRDSVEGVNEPAGPQPEQIRLLTYCALGAGYRGLGFWSDRFLADSHRGRDRLLAMALLNQELELLEPILVQATRAPEWIGTSRPEVMAAVIRAPQAVLVLPIWLGTGSQCVPGQAALTEVSITVPVPITSTAWEVSPGHIRSLQLKRVQGGVQVTLRNFSLTSALVFSSDLSPTGMVVSLQDQQRRMGRLAAQWLCDQAREETQKVEQVLAALERHGQALPDAQAIMKRAREALERAQRHRRNGEHAEAYSDAEVSLRALRVLMRAHWDRATRDLDTPVASPYALSFYTLPKHWEFLDELHRLKPGPSVLPHGDFEWPAKQAQPGWTRQDEPTLDPVKVEVARVTTLPRSGKQCLLLHVFAKEPTRAPAVLERTWVAVHSPEVHLEPGTLVRISAWVRTLVPIQASTDGALFYDSIGGEPLAVRIRSQPTWKKYSLYRRVPPSGTVRVTLANSGIGAVYFDDVRIEPLVSSASASLSGPTRAASAASPTAPAPARPGNP
jgi:hypothetical protein